MINLQIKAILHSCKISIELLCYIEKNQWWKNYEKIQKKYVQARRYQSDYVTIQFSIFEPVVWGDGRTRGIIYTYSREETIETQNHVTSSSFLFLHPCTQQSAHLISRQLANIFKFWTTTSVSLFLLSFFLFIYQLFSDTVRCSDSTFSRINYRRLFRVTKRVNSNTCPVFSVFCSFLQLLLENVHRSE